MCLINNLTLICTAALGSDVKQCTCFKLILLPYHNLHLAFSISLKALAFGSGLPWQLGASFFSPLSQWCWTSQYSSNSHVILHFYFSLDSPTVTQCHLMILLGAYMKTHRANSLTNVLVTLHCKQTQAALWIPAVSRFDRVPGSSQASTGSSTGALFPGSQRPMSFPPSMAHIWLSHLSYQFVWFLHQHLHASSYALMFHRWFPRTSTPWLWCVLKISPKKNPIMQGAGTATHITNSMFSFLTLHPLFALLLGC